MADVVDLAHARCRRAARAAGVDPDTITTTAMISAMECAACGFDMFVVWADDVVSCARCKIKIRNIEVKITFREDDKPVPTV